MTYAVSTFATLLLPLTLGATEVRAQAQPDPGKKACVAEARRLCPMEMKSMSRKKVEAAVPMRRLGSIEEFASFCANFIDGSFTFTVNLQGLSTIAGTVKAAKSGYRANTFNFSANSGQTVTQDISIVRDTTTGVPSAVPVAAITPQSSTSVMSSIEPSSRNAGMRTSG